MKPIDPATITQPLPLAALAVILLFGLLDLLVKAPDRPQLKALIHYTFLTSLVVIVLVAGFFLLREFLHREIRVTGVVVNDSGEPIEGAKVNLLDVDIDVTDSSGRFQLNVPDSRKQAKYTAHIIASGYLALTDQLPGPAPGSRIYTLTPQTAPAPTLKLKPDATIGHHLGMPYVRVRIGMSNPGPSELTFTNLRMVLRGPMEKVIELPPLMVFATTGQLIGPASPIQVLKKSEDLDWVYSFFYLDPESMKVGEMANSEWVAKPSDIPDTTVDRYSDETTQRLQEYMENKFTWTAGDWIMSVTSVAGEKRVSDQGHFSLTDADISGMRAISAHYKSGIGVVNAWVAYRSGTIRPEVEVSLSPN